MNVGTGKCDRSALRVIRALGPGAGELGFFCSMEAHFQKADVTHHAALLCLLSRAITTKL